MTKLVDYTKPIEIYDLSACIPNVMYVPREVKDFTELKYRFSEDGLHHCTYRYRGTLTIGAFDDAGTPSGTQMPMIRNVEVREPYPAPPAIAAEFAKLRISELETKVRETQLKLEYEIAAHRTEKERTKYYQRQVEALSSLLAKADNEIAQLRSGASLPDEDDEPNRKLNLPVMTERQFGALLSLIGTVRNSTDGIALHDAIKQAKLLLVGGDE